MFPPFPLFLLALFSDEFSDGLQELLTVGVKRTIGNALWNQPDRHQSAILREDSHLLHSAGVAGEAWKSSGISENKEFCLDFLVYLGVFRCHVNIYLIWKTFSLWFRKYWWLIQCMNCRAFTQTKRNSWYRTALDWLLQLSLISVL